MSKEFIWIEALFNRIHLPYFVVSLIIATVIFLVFEFISFKVPSSLFNMHKYVTPVISISILIAYQLGGIQYLLRDMRKVFKNLCCCQENNPCVEDLNKKFTNKNLYYITVISVVAVFLIIDIRQINCYQLWNHQSGSYYQLGSTCIYNRSNICGSYTLFTPPCDFSNSNLLIHSWRFYLDVYRYAVSYLSYCLLGIILWIIFNISLVLGDLREDLYKSQIKVDIYNVDKIGGLKPLFNFILNVSIYYFICITLMIASKINPVTPAPLEITFLIVLLFIGLSFFFWGRTVVQNIFTQKIQVELHKINLEYEVQRKELISLLSQKKDPKSQEELTFVLRYIELLNKERDGLMQLKTNVIDIYNLILFISSVLSTLVVIFQRYHDLQPLLKGLLLP